MAERRDSDREVLTSLPRSRPVRRSAKRADRPPATKAAQAQAKAAPKPAAKAAAKRPRQPAAPRPAAAKPPPETAPRRKVPAAGYAAPQAHADSATASAGAELISTTIQAAGELAQIGLTVGRQTLRSMLERLPKP